MLSQVILKEYFHCLAVFNYEKAKQIIEDSHPSNRNDYKSNISKLFDILLQLIGLEKKYYGLAFVSNRRKSIFSRKEKHGEGYQDIFDRATVIVTDEVDNVLGRECLVLFCSVRSRMIDMYLNISQMNRNTVKSIGDIIAIVRPLKDCLTEILSKDNETVVNILNPVLSMMELEVDILLQLGEAQNLMSNLYFLMPINLLYSVEEKYQKFKELTTSLTTSSSIFSRSVSFSLVSWLYKFYVASLAKYTLYFHSVLMRQKGTLLSINDPFYENVSFDLISRIGSFVKRTSASNLLLIFDAAKQNVPFLGHGYVFPFSRGEKVSGIQSFPIIFSCPLETEVSKQLICNLVALVMNVIHATDNVDVIEHFIEPNNSKTYFLSRVEDRMYLAIVYDVRREKDKMIISFMDEIRDSLTGRFIINELTLPGT